MLHLKSQGVTKALHTQAQTLTVQKASLQTYTGGFGIFCHLLPHLQSLKEVSESIIRGDYKGTSKLHMSTVWWVGIV